MTASNPIQINTGRHYDTLQLIDCFIVQHPTMMNPVYTVYINDASRGLDYLLTVTSYYADKVLDAYDANDVIYNYNLLAQARADYKLISNFTKVTP